MPNPFPIDMQTPVQGIQTPVLGMQAPVQGMQTPVQGMQPLPDAELLAEILMNGKAHITRTIEEEPEPGNYNSGRRFSRQKRDVPVEVALGIAYPIPRTNTPAAPSFRNPAPIRGGAPPMLPIVSGL